MLTGADGIEIVTETAAFLPAVQYYALFFGTIVLWSHFVRKLERRWLIRGNHLGTP